MKILVLDNYDSFTFNLVHILRHLGYGKTMDVIRNDHMTVADVAKYDKVVFSPGPGIPDEAGIMKQVITEYATSKSMIGVCLGHQGIGEVFGAKLYNMPIVRHGVTAEVEVLDDSERLFHDLPGKFQVCLYHSWAVEESSIPSSLAVTARDEHGTVMGLQHKSYDIRGVQFHPEKSQQDGLKLLGAFNNLPNKTEAAA